MRVPVEHDGALANESRFRGFGYGKRFGGLAPTACGDTRKAGDPAFRRREQQCSRSIQASLTCSGSPECIPDQSGGAKREACVREKPRSNRSINRWGNGGRGSETGGAVLRTDQHASVEGKG